MTLSYEIPPGVVMTEVLPSPWGCMTCHKVARTYGDGTVFCEVCGKPLSDEDRINISRGPQKNTPTPDWKPLKAD